MIKFVSTNVDDIDLEIVSTVENLLDRKLYPADPLYVFLKGLEAIIIQQRALINFCGNMNLLSFSKGEYLDALGELVGCERLAASYAVCSVEVTLTDEREQSTIIPKGTRITAGDNIFFALDEDVILGAGEITKSARATCQSIGEVGNNYKAGELDKMVEPLAFVESIINTTTTALGADEEDDDSYRERIRLCVESFSCAGSEGAYKYHAKSASALITDIQVTSPVPGFVDIYVLCNGYDETPTEVLTAVDNKLNAKVVRPLTDTVTVKTPDKISYSLNVNYWIRDEDSSKAAQIVNDVKTACAEYIQWQGSELGKDLNPSKLIEKIMGAGAKRVEVISPVFTTLTATEHAVCANPNYEPRFIGLEPD